MTEDWDHFSRKLCYKAEYPLSAGIFSPQDAENHRMRLVVAKTGSFEDGNCLVLYWLLDPADGIIADAKFQLYGSPLLIGAADALCDLCVGKTYDQAGRLTIEHIEKSVRDQSQKPAFPQEWNPLLQPLIHALKQMAAQCRNIPLNEVISPIPQEALDSSQPYPQWEGLSLEQKLALIEEVLTQEIRPYIEMDEGGIEVLNLLNDHELIIAYQGACTSCFSSVGATLSGIQEILRAKVHPELIVVPNLDDLQFSPHA